MFDWLLQLLRLKPQEPQRVIELTVSDQWILKILLRDDKRALEEQDLVHEVLEERPTQVPHDVQAAIRKLVLVGALLQEESGGYRVTPGAKRLKGILPDRPGVNMDYYG